MTISVVLRACQGGIFRNIVYLELLRRRADDDTEIYYYKKSSCDLIITDHERDTISDGEYSINVVAAREWLVSH